MSKVIVGMTISLGKIGCGESAEWQNAFQIPHRQVDDIQSLRFESKFQIGSSVLLVGKKITGREQKWNTRAWARQG